MYIQPQDVPSEWRGLFPEYRGRFFQFHTRETVTIHDCDLHWSEGSRDEYRAYAFDQSRQVQPITDWTSQNGERVVTLRPGCVLAMHTISCGKDLGVTFFIHPSDATPLLRTVILTDEERDVLKAHKVFKSSYNGRNRRQMWNDDAQYTKGRTYSETEWNAIVDQLKANKFLNKAGAITVSGRNAVS